MTAETPALGEDAYDVRSLDPRPLVVLAAAPLIGLGHAVAFYGGRAGLVPYWTAQGLPIDAIFETLSAASWAPIVGSLLGIVVALLAGGWSAALVGGVLLSVGLLGLGGAFGEDLTLWMVLAGTGRTAAGLGVLIAVADAFRGGRLWLGVAALAALLMGVNVGASGVSVLAGQGRGVLEGGLWFPGLAVLALTSTGVTLLAAVAWWVLGRSSPEPDGRRRKVVALPLLLALPATAAGALALLCMYRTMDLGFSAVYDSTGTSLIGVFQWMQPLVALGMGGLVVGGAVAAHVLGAPRRPLAVVAAGSLLAAVALLPLVAGPYGAMTTVLLMIVAEFLVLPFWIPALARGVHWRLLALTVGLGRLGLDAGGWLLSGHQLELFSPGWIRTLVLAASALILVAIVAGLGAWLVPPRVSTARPDPVAL